MVKLPKDVYDQFYKEQLTCPNCGCSQRHVVTESKYTQESVHYPASEMLNIPQFGGGNYRNRQATVTYQKAESFLRYRCLKCGWKTRWNKIHSIKRESENEQFSEGSPDYKKKQPPEEESKEEV